jgi:hypothetical protein
VENLIHDVNFPDGTAHQLTFKVEAEYILARATGERTRLVVSSLLIEIAQAAIENKRGKILVDVRGLEGWLSILDSYLIVTKDFHQFRGKGIVKAAIVDRTHPKMGEWFFENVAHNWAFNLRIFESPEVALEWLIGTKAGG